MAHAVIMESSQAVTDDGILVEHAVNYLPHKAAQNRNSIGNIKKVKRIIIIVTDNSLGRINILPLCNDGCTDVHLVRICCYIKDKMCPKINHATLVAIFNNYQYYSTSPRWI